jgi:hypothetical protein
MADGKQSGFNNLTGISYFLMVYAPHVSQEFWKWELKIKIN